MADDVEDCTADYLDMETDKDSDIDDHCPDVLDDARDPDVEVDILAGPALVVDIVVVCLTDPALNTAPRPQDSIT